MLLHNVHIELEECEERLARSAMGRLSHFQCDKTSSNLVRATNKKEQKRLLQELIKDAEGLRLYNINNKNGKFTKMGS